MKRTKKRVEDPFDGLFNGAVDPFDGLVSAPKVLASIPISPQRDIFGDLASEAVKKPKMPLWPM